MLVMIDVYEPTRDEDKRGGRQPRTAGTDRLVCRSRLVVSLRTVRPNSTTSRDRFSVARAEIH